jgi:hypothetical protein
MRSATLELLNAEKKILYSHFDAIIACTVETMSLINLRVNQQKCFISNNRSFTESVIRV